MAEMKNLKVALFDLLSTRLAVEGCKLVSRKDAFVRKHDDFTQQFQLLIVNPLKVIQQHAEKKTHGLRKEYLNTLLDRGNEVKAKDIHEIIPPLANVKTS